MTITTIPISTQTREKIREFGHKGETWDAILNRLYESACQRQIDDILMNKNDTISIKQALKEAEEKYGN